MYIFYGIIALIPILGCHSFYLLRKWIRFKQYVIINTIVLATYTYGILYSGIHFFAQDPWELKKIFLFLYIIAFHAVGSFIFALIYHYKFAKRWESTNHN
jgi:hypothetical protein